MSYTEMNQLEGDTLAHLGADEFSIATANHENAGGCYTIFPGVQICWEVKSAGNIRVCLRLAGQEIVCGNINPENPSITLEGSLVFVKASVRLYIEGTCLKYEAKACARANPFGSWSCTSVSGKIVCF